jgi:8-oxo-dGTP diphosphatase
VSAEPQAPADADDTRPWIEVAAAVLEQPDGRFLLAQRPEGKVYAGWWEFPGGKVEAGETARDALVRELAEELDIGVRHAWPWIERRHVYAHGRVRLRFFRVTAWDGVPRGREGQAFAWQRLPDLDVGPILPANGPILAALALPVVMRVTDASVDDACIDATLAAHGPATLLQARRHDLDATGFDAWLGARLAAWQARGARVVANGDPRRLAACGITGVHLTAARLAALDARPAFDRVGASCHDAADLDRAEALGLDYAVLGNVHPTPSHPDRGGALGWPRFAALIAGRTLPVYAIGGLGPEDLDVARAHGAHGIAALRAAWRA